MDFTNMPALFLMHSMVINYSIISDTVLFILESPVTIAYLKTMTYHLHVYACDKWDRLSNPNIDFSRPSISEFIAPHTYQTSCSVQL